VRVISVLLVIWLIIGAIAGAQRHYYSGSIGCAKASTVLVTVAAGPLNYTGVNPKVNCHVPQPSK
jgi:hypothetical protein